MGICMSMGRMLTSFRLCKHSGVNQTHFGIWDPFHKGEKGIHPELRTTIIIILRQVPNKMEFGLFLATKRNYDTLRRLKNTTLSTVLSLFYVYMFLGMYYVYRYVLSFFRRFEVELGCHGS